MANERYFIRIEGGPWKRVSREEFREHERLAGFYPKGDPDNLATHEFSGNSSRGYIEGRITQE